MPLLAASGALFDGFGRWIFLHETAPRQRALVGGGLAALAAAAAAHFAPPATSLPGDELWRAIQEPPALLVLVCLGLALLLVEVAVASRQLETSATQ